MLRIKLHSISWILLTYFMFFIVPPLSTFASITNPADGSVARLELKQCHDQATLLLFDIILWQNLKKTKHSQEFVSSFSGGRHVNEGFTASLDALAFVHSVPEAGLAVFLGSSMLLDSQSRSSSIRFTRSGISPPVVTA